MLQSLNLGFCEQITDAGLAQIGAMKSLRFLELDGTEITDSGLIQLKGLSNLEELGLANTPTTKDCLGHLKALVKLKTLVIMASIKDGDIRQFSEQMPQVKIIR